MIGKAMHICQVIPVVKARKMIRISVMMNNEARYEMRRDMFDLLSIWLKYSTC